MPFLSHEEVTQMSLDDQVHVSPVTYSRRLPLKRAEGMVKRLAGYLGMDPGMESRVYRSTLGERGGDTKSALLIYYGRLRGE